jgi:hypothetical protein
MKQKDIIVLIVVGFIAAVFSLILSQTLFSTKKLDQKAEVVEKITADFPDPDKSVFNENAIDPTQLIQIGDTPNSNPF